MDSQRDHADKADEQAPVDNGDRLRDVKLPVDIGDRLRDIILHAPIGAASIGDVFSDESAQERERRRASKVLTACSSLGEKIWRARCRSDAAKVDRFFVFFHLPNLRICQRSLFPCDEKTLNEEIARELRGLSHLFERISVLQKIIEW